MYYYKLILIILLVDGLKLIFDSISYLRAVRRKQEMSRDFSDVSMCISAYRVEKTIGGLVDSLIESGFLPENIFIVNDGSPDKTYESLKKITHKINIFDEPNKNKVAALNWLSEKVTTKYMIISDSDNIFPKDFAINKEFFENEKITASSFNVVPFHEDSNALVALQEYEYKKNMAFSKEGKSKTGSVTCISGAIGLFRTDRFNELKHKHSMEFSGEDLQRTLIEQIHDGEVVHSNSEIYTECPNTTKSIYNQRLHGWGPATFHCFPLFLRLLFSKKTHVKLKYDMFYEILTTLMDPLKIISFFYLLFTGRYMELLAIYVIYLVIETVIKLVIKSKIKFTLMLYPFYNFGTILLKPLAFCVYLKKRFITKKMKPMRWFLTLALLSIPFLGESQELIVNNQAITDYKNQTETQYNINLYAGYKTWYAESDLLVNPNVSLGKYYGNSWANVRYREADLSLNLFQYVKVLNYPNNLYINYRQIREFESERNIFLGGLTYERYLNDNSVLQLTVLKEHGRLNDWIYRARYKYKKHLSIAAGINNFGYKNFAIDYRLKRIFLSVSYEEHFDYNNYDRLMFSVGYQFKF